MITESKMTYQEALKVLGATGSETSAEMSKLFKRASLRNHPDRGGSNELMQQINQAYDVVTKTGPGGARTETQGDIRARYAQQKKEWEEKLDAYHAIAKNYFGTKFNAQEFSDYFTTFTGQPTTFTYDLKKGSHTVTAIFKYRSGDAMFDFEFICQPPSSNGGLVAPDASSLGNVSVDTDVLVGTKKYKMARREYQWGKNPDKVTPESLFPSIKLKKIFSPEAQHKQVYKRADYMSAFIKHLNANRNGDDNISIPVGKYTVHFARQVMMRKGSYVFNYIIEPEVNKFRPVERLKGWMLEDEEGACLDMIIDTFKELQRIKPDAKTIASVVEKMYSEFSAGHRSASFVKRMASKEAAPKPEEKAKRTVNRITKEDYFTALKAVGASGSDRYWQFDNGAGITLHMQRVLENRKGVWNFTSYEFKHDGVRQNEWLKFSVEEKTDGSTIALMADTLKSLRGIADWYLFGQTLKQMEANYKAGNYSAPHVKKQAEQKKTAEAQKDELGAQPTKPTQAKKEEPKIDKAQQAENAREVAAMNNTIRKMLAQLVKAGRHDTPEKIKEAVEETIKLWKLTY